MKKGTYRIVQGDATLPQRESDDEIVIIPHVCNNLGGWGAGFVLALGKRFGDEPEKAYRLIVASNSLGQTSFCDLREEYGIKIANMIAQNGYIGEDNPRPLDYGALVKCMQAVVQEIHYALYSLPVKKTIHCPKFGSALAGGNWEFIEALIEDIWLAKGIDVTVYEYVPPSNLLNNFTFEDEQIP
jgi:hypothetical protein